MFELLIIIIILSTTVLGIISVKNLQKVKYNSFLYFRNEQIEACKNNDINCNIFYK